MKRCKWVLLTTDKPHALVGRRLLGNRFSADTGWGFDVTRRSEQEIVCRFIKRTVLVEKIEDPFGGVTEVETVRYQIMQFRLHLVDSSAFNYYLEVEAPPRSIKPLIDALSETLDGVAVEEPNWAILDLYKQVKRKSIRARIAKLKAGDILCSETSTVRLEIASTVDAFSDYLKMFHGEAKKVQKIRIESPFSTALGFLEIGATGVCSFDEDAEDEVRLLILSVSY